MMSTYEDTVVRSQQANGPLSCKQMDYCWALGLRLRLCWLGFMRLVNGTLRLGCMGLSLLVRRGGGGGRRCSYLQLTAAFYGRPIGHCNPALPLLYVFSEP